MPRKQRKKPPAEQRGPMRWAFDADIAAHDFFESGSLDDMWNLQEAVDCFVHWLENDRFLTWEAVACEEQGIRLTPSQKKVLGSLLNFNDEDDDQILYIDENCSRRPWKPGGRNPNFDWVEELRAEQNLPYVSLTEKRRYQRQADKFLGEEDDA